jgi:ribonuclease BN (tRNA processing enzyme)
MNVTIVGSSGSYGGPGNPCSCYLVEHDGFRVVVDFGNGALGELQRYGSIYDIDAVLLSHLHADHCVDLCGYYVARKYRPAPEGPPPPIDVWGPSGTRERIAQAYDTDALECEAAFNFRNLMEDTEPGATENTFKLGPFTVTAALVNHPIEAYAIRLSADGKSFVYSGDTAPCDALDRIAAGADLFLSEAAFQEPRDSGLGGVHLNGREAGECATRAGVGRLVLTHIPPWTDSGLNLTAARTSYTRGPVELAQPGAVYSI